MPYKLKKTFALLVFTCIYLLFYFLFKNNNLIPGTVDTWYNLSIMKDVEWLLSFRYNTSSNYPEGFNFMYAEYSFLSGFLFTVLNFFLNNDYDSYVGFHVLVGVLNAYSLFLLSFGFFKNSFLISFTTAILFCFFSFNIAFFDNVIYTIWFPLFLSLFFILKSRRLNNKKYVFIAVFFLSINIYFSVYNFLMSLIVASIILLYNINIIFSKPKVLLTSLNLLLLLILPYFLIYFTFFKSDDFYLSILNLDFISAMSLNFSDLKNSLSSNLIYGDFKEYNIFDYWRILNSGFLLPLLSILGCIFIKNKTQKIFVTIFIIGFFLSFNIGSPIFELKSYFYKSFPFLFNFKLVFKFYYLVIFALVFFASAYLALVLNRFRSLIGKLFFVILILTIFLMENFPLKPTEHSTKFDTILIDEEILKKLRQQNAVVLFLPSFPSNFHEDSKINCREYIFQQEYKYLYWQKIIDLNIINGYGRLLNKVWGEIDKNFEPDTLLSVFKYLNSDFGLTHIIYIHEFRKECNFFDVSILKDNFSVTLDSNQITIYEII